jgi:catechol 2,3-dioxygenase-like lactoylglutathione lyase family enzyme
MLNAISHSAIFVLDQDEALDFYVGKLGFEVSADVDMGFMRWLTVNVPGDDRHILLERPGPPGMDDDAAEQVRELVTKGATGLGFILTTDDCRAAYEDLRAKGVEFHDEPTERFYGIDCGFRDPFGNNIRMTQPVDGPIEYPG